MLRFREDIHASDYNLVTAHTPGHNPAEAEFVRVSMRRKVDNQLDVGILHRGGVFRSAMQMPAGLVTVQRRASNTLLRNFFTGAVGDRRYDNEQRLRSLQQTFAVPSAPAQHDLHVPPHATNNAPVGDVSPESMLIDRCWRYFSMPANKIDWVQPGAIKRDSVRDSAIGAKIDEAEAKLEPLSEQATLAARESAKSFIAHLLSEFPINNVTDSIKIHAEKLFSNIIGDLSRIDINSSQKNRLTSDLTSKVASLLFPAPAQTPATLKIIDSIHAANNIDKTRLPPERFDIAAHAGGLFEERLSRENFSHPKMILVQTRLAQTLNEYLVHGRAIPADAYEQAVKDS